MDDVPFRIKLLGVRLLEPITRIRRYLSSPRMLWGYRNCDGKFHPLTRISNTAYLYKPTNIDISNNVFISHYTILDGTEKLTLNEGTAVGAWVAILTHSNHISLRLHGKRCVEIKEKDRIGRVSGPVSIGSYAFIGPGAMIFPGVTIGCGAIVTANCVVRRDVPDFAIVSGDPAKIAGDARDIDRRYLKKHPRLLEEYSRWQQEVETQPK